MTFLFFIFFFFFFFPKGNRNLQNCDSSLKKFSVLKPYQDAFLIEDTTLSLSQGQIEINGT